MVGRRWFPLAVVLGVGALGLATPALRATDHPVQAGSGTTFSPQLLTIQVGDTVTWTHVGSFSHNVVADDGSFRCAAGCDGEGGNGTPSNSSWSFTRTFNTAGTVGYHCEVHGSPGSGMFGTITVQGAPVPGNLHFTTSNFSVGEAGGSASITVARVGGTSGAVSIDFATSDGSATAGSDYTAANGTLNWADGDGANKSFTVPITNDTEDEPNETVGLTLSNPTGGATLDAPSSATLTITDNDPPPVPGTLAFSASTYSTPEAGSAAISVTRTGGASGVVSITYATSDGTATAGSDYTAANGMLAWANGDSATKSFLVPIASDTVSEPDETVNLTLSTPTGGATLGSPSSATLTIADDDLPPSAGTLAFAAISFSEPEEGGEAMISVLRSGGTSGAVAILYATSPGTATAGADYTSASGSLSWADGEGGLKSFPVPIVNDAQLESNETVMLTLSSPSGGATLGSPSSATLTIVDDDSPPIPGTLALGASTFSGPEGGVATISVTRQNGAGGAVSISYATSDGTATAGADYTAASGTVSFADGQGGTKTFPIALLADAAVEGTESFTITLSSPTGGAVLGNPSSADVKILDSAGGPGDLSADEVACDRLRLTGLLARSAATAGAGKLTNLNLSFTGTGDFAGIATVGSGPATAEKALAFSSNPEETTLLRNPVRPQLFSVSLTRNDLNSDLVTAGALEAIRLAINPTLDANPPAGNLLAIDNVSGAAGRIADAKPGRGLAPLLSPCHEPFSDRDVHVFRVLAKMARGELSGAPRTEVAIYRGMSAGSYRLDVFPYNASGGSLGRLSAQLDVTFDGAGQLLGGELRILPRCTAGQTSDCTDVTGAAALALYKPVVSGASTTFIRLINGTAGFEWGELLDESTWRKPL